MGIYFIAIGICFWFFADAQEEVQKDRPEGHPDYGKGEFWSVVWGLFIVIFSGALIWQLI